MTKASEVKTRDGRTCVIMATDTDTEPSWTFASYWARPNSHRSTPASILRADLTANLTDLPAEDATALLAVLASGSCLRSSSTRSSCSFQAQWML